MQDECGRVRLWLRLRGEGGIISLAPVAPKAHNQDLTVYIFYSFAIFREIYNNVYILLYIDKLFATGH